MGERRQEDYDRDFTAMVSGLEMEGFRPSAPAAEPSEPPDLRAGPPPRGDDRWSDLNLQESIEEADPSDPHPREYTPAPLPPMRAPSGKGIVGWLCAGYVLAALMLTIVGVRLPNWAGWLAVVAFAAAILIGWRSLPRDRDPDSGDGAVV